VQAKELSGGWPFSPYWTLVHWVPQAGGRAALGGVRTQRALPVRLYLFSDAAHHGEQGRATVGHLLLSPERESIPQFLAHMRPVVDTRMRG
jgi:hypothetical protein